MWDIWDEVVRTNNVKGGIEDGDQLSQGKCFVGSQLVVLWLWNGPNYSISAIIRGRFSHNLQGVNDKFPRSAQDKVILNFLPMINSHILYSLKIFYLIILILRWDIPCR
jgi:hypothetical protein